jgi:hypothetical protein
MTETPRLSRTSLIVRSTRWRSRQSSASSPHYLRLRNVAFHGRVRRINADRDLGPFPMKLEHQDDPAVAGPPRRWRLVRSPPAARRRPVCGQGVPDRSPLIESLRNNPLGLRGRFISTGEPSLNSLAHASFAPSAAGPSLYQWRRRIRRHFLIRRGVAADKRGTTPDRVSVGPGRTPGRRW